MNNQQLVAFLKKNLACRPALEWLQARTLAEAWEQSERGDWLLWLAAKAGVDRRRLVMAACACARLALVHVPPGEERPRVAIETAEAWCRGEATIEQVRKACRNADAAYDAAADAAAAAYDAAADAAYDAAYVAAYVAADADADADAAADAADADAAYAAAAADAAAAAADAAYVAADAAYADAADAAYVAADAAYAAAAAAADAAADADDARASALKKAADLVRGLISCAEVEAAINGTKE